MMYKRLEDGTHQLNITGPELANIAKLVASTVATGGNASFVGGKLFDILRFQAVYQQSQLSGVGLSCFETVYKRTADGVIQIYFTDAEYLTMLNLILDLRDDAATIRRRLFDALGFQEAFTVFMNSPEGPDIFIRSSPEEGHG